MWGQMVVIPITVFERNCDTGELTLLQELFDGQNGITALDDPEDFILSPNGKHLYVTTDIDGALVVLQESNPLSISFELSMKLFLQGPYLNGFMRDDLRVSSLLPLQEPFQTGNNERTNLSLLNQIAVPNDAIVDWILIELRDVSNPSIVIAQKAVLLQRDGDIVDHLGVSPFRFTGVKPGDYYVAAKHRNHLGVMTATPKTFN